MALRKTWVGKFWPDLEILEAFVMVLEVSCSGNFASLEVSKLETQVSQSRKVLNLPFYTPNSGVRVREREKTKKDERKTGERTVPSLSPHAQTPRCFFCMLRSLFPAFPQSGRLEKIVRRFFSSRFFHSYPKQRACSQATWKTKMDSE